MISKVLTFFISIIFILIGAYLIVDSKRTTQLNLTYPAQTIAVEYEFESDRIYIQSNGNTDSIFIDGTIYDFDLNSLQALPISDFIPLSLYDEPNPMDTWIHTGDALQPPANCETVVIALQYDFFPREVSFKDTLRNISCKYS